MIDKIQLNDAELEKVNGGSDTHLIKTAGDKSKYSSTYFYILSFEEPVQGRTYLFEDHDGNWLFGRLSNVYKNWAKGWIYDVDVEDGMISGGIYVSEWNTIEVEYDYGWRVYRN